MKPLRDYIVVTKEDMPKTTPSGLYMPTSEHEKLLVGTVKAVGNGHLTTNGTIVPLEVAVGNKVAFHKSMAIDFKDGSDTVLLVREEHLVAIL